VPRGSGPCRARRCSRRLIVPPVRDERRRADAPASSSASAATYVREAPRERRVIRRSPRPVDTAPRASVDRRESRALASISTNLPCSSCSPSVPSCTESTHRGIPRESTAPTASCRRYPRAKLPGERPAKPIRTPRLMPSDVRRTSIRGVHRVPRQPARSPRAGPWRRSRRTCAAVTHEDLDLAGRESLDLDVLLGEQLEHRLASPRASAHADADHRDLGDLVLERDRARQRRPRETSRAPCLEDLANALLRSPWGPVNVRSVCPSTPGAADQSTEMCVGELGERRAATPALSRKILVG